MLGFRPWAERVGKRSATRKKREQKYQQDAQRLAEAIVKAQKPRWPKLLAIWTPIAAVITAAGFWIGLAVDYSQLSAKADIINPALDDARWPFSVRFDFVVGGPYSVYDVRLMCFLLEGRFTNSGGRTNRWTLNDMNVLLGGRRIREMEEVKPNSPLTAQCAPAFKNDTNISLTFMDMVVKYRFERWFPFTKSLRPVHCDVRRFVYRPGLNGKLQWYMEGSYKIPPEISARTGMPDCW